VEITVPINRAKTNFEVRYFMRGGNQIIAFGAKAFGF
jgi:hypothetical protein